MTAPRPIWLLDVDGVLNAVCADIPDGYERITANRFAMTFRPDITSRIRELHESGAVEVRWLTTWCQYASDLLAEPFGLPTDLVVEGTDDMVTVLRGWWKSITARRVSEQEPDRPLIWTDDDLDHSERCGEIGWLRDRTAPTLTISPDWRTGLTSAQLQLITEFSKQADR